MQRPVEVDVEFSPGKWPKGQKAAAKALVGSALPLALYWLQDCGLGSIIEEPKSATIYQCSSTWPAGGESYDEKHFELNIPYVALKHRRKILDMVGSISTISIHELIHCLRFEHFPIDSLAEHCASEALAYYVACLFEDAIGISYYPTSYLDHVRKLDSGMMSKYQDMLAKDIEHEVPDSNDLLIRKWAMHDGPNIGAGTLIGMNGLFKLIDSGITLTDAMVQPSEQILFSKDVTFNAA